MTSSDISSKRVRKVRAAFEAYVDPKYIQHNPGVVDGRETANVMLTGLFGTNGATFDIKRIIVDGNLAVIHVHGRPEFARAES